MTADKIRALMSIDPSQPLNLLRLARAGEQLQGEMDIDQLPRVKAAVKSAEGAVTYCLDFDFDEAERLVVECAIKASPQLVCQRCLQPMQVQVARESRLALISDKSEMQELPSGVEPLMSDEQEALTLTQLLEDELLLALPFAPLHPDEACSASEDVKRIQEEGKHNPFAVLEKLKKND